MDKNSMELQSQFSAYVKTAVKNTKIHYLQKKQKIRENEVVLEFLEDIKECGTEDVLLQVDAAADKIFDGMLEMKMLLDQISDSKLFQILVMLPSQHKNIILLRIFYEKSFREIGEIMGIPEKKAENTYFNTIKKIRRTLGGNGHEI